MTSAVHPGIVKRSNAYFVNPTMIDRQPGFNPRFDFGEIAELAKSIDANGLLNPIRVKRAGDRFVLIDGDRRLTAIESLLKQGKVFDGGIPAIIVEKSQDDLTSLIQMFEANSGKAFLPLEEAAAYKRMRDAGLTINQIAEKVGKGFAHIIDTVALLDAAPEVQEAVKKGKVGATLAKALVSAAKGDKAKQAEIIAEAAAAGKDKIKRRAVIAKIDAVKDAKAAAKAAVKKAQGKKVSAPRIRQLKPDQLSALGARIAKHLTSLLKEAKLDEKADLAELVKKDERLAVAFTYGALEALKAAAGAKVELEI